MNFIHRFIPGDAPETLLLLHGTGGNEDDLLPLGRQLAPGWNLLSPRGKVLEHGMPRFFRRLAEGVFDQQDLRERTQELDAFLDDASAQYKLDRKRIFAAGYSNGANIAASLMLTKPESLAGAILFRPMIPFEPVPGLKLDGVPVFVGAGRNDRVIPPGSPDRLIAALKTAGASITEHWHPGGHELSQQDLEKAKLWLSGIVAPQAR